MGLVITIVLAVVVYGAVLDEGDDMALRDAGVVTTTPVVSEALDGEVPSAVCAVEERSIASAISLYTVTEGGPPADVDVLVAGGWIDDVPAYHDLQRAADGSVTVVPVPDGGCD